MPPSPCQRKRHFTALLIACVCALIGVATAQTLTITTVDGHSTSLSAAQIAAATHVTVTADDHGTPAKFEGFRSPPF